MPSIVVTLGTMTIFRGTIFLLAGGQWVNAHQMSDSFKALPRTVFLELPVSTWITIAVIGLFALLMSRTPLGRAFYAVGVNPTASVYTGIDVGRTRFFAFAFAGMVSGLAGYLWVARYAVAYVDIAGGFELSIIAAWPWRCLHCRRHRHAGGAVLRRLFRLPQRPAGHQRLLRPDGDFGRGDRHRRDLQRPQRAQARPHHLAESRGGGRRMNEAPQTPRTIPDRLESPFRSALKSWEMLLIVVAVAIFIANSFASPYFLNPWSLSDATFNFTEKAIIWPWPWSSFQRSTFRWPRS